MEIKGQELSGIMNKITGAKYYTSPFLVPIAGCFNLSLLEIKVNFNDNVTFYFKAPKNNTNMFDEDGYEPRLHITVDWSDVTTELKKILVEQIQV